MALPIEVYTELAERYGVRLHGRADNGMALGLRVLENAAAPEDGYLYAEAPTPGFLNAAMDMERMLEQWLMRMDFALENGTSPQELVDISEGVLDQPILVADPSMKRLAATRSIQTADVFFNEVAQLGYPTPETYDEMGKAQYYDHRFYTGDIVRLQTQAEPPLDVALQAMRTGGRLMATALMLFQRKPWSEGQVKLFSMLTRRLARCLQSGQARVNMRSRQYEFLLRDLLDGKKLSEDEVQARLSYTDYPHQGACYGVVFAPDTPSAGKLSYICRVLEGVFRMSRPLVYEGLAFTTLPARDGGKSESLEELRRFCAETGCTCGISARMERLSELHNGFLQARDALSTGKRLCREGTWFSLSAGDAPERRVFYHEIFAPYRVILAFGEKGDISSLCCRGLRLLREYDAQNGTDNMLVLYHYLTSHMSYTEAARRLFMHRNSIIYRINRICEIMGMESISHEEEVALRFSYMTLDMM